ncbi:unnamed protein product [Brassica oleracea]
MKKRKSHRTAVKTAFVELLKTPNVAAWYRLIVLGKKEEKVELSVSLSSGETSISLEFLKPPWKLLYKGNHKDPSYSEPSVSNRGQRVIVIMKAVRSLLELKGPPSRSSLENCDWSKAESLVKIELQADVELIRSSTRGFAVSIH